MNKELTVEKKKMIAGYFELQISFQGKNTYWDLDEAQYILDLILVDIKKDMKLLLKQKVRSNDYSP